MLKNVIYEDEYKAGWILKELTFLCEREGWRGGSWRWWKVLHLFTVLWRPVQRRTDVLCLGKEIKRTTEKYKSFVKSLKDAWACIRSTNSRAFEIKKNNNKIELVDVTDHKQYISSRV